MTDVFQAANQIHAVTSFREFLSTPLRGAINAVCWQRELAGDFAEIVEKAAVSENMVTLSQQDLLALELSNQGKLARETLLNDLNLLEGSGNAPTLNVIKCYDRDDSYPFFPTDVYSFHVDRSPVPADTILCTYYGEPSDLLPNEQATQKVLIPEIRDTLKKLYDGPEEGFETFLQEYFFDLHYQPKPNANPISLGVGHLWRLAIDHPESEVLPCLHRAPQEKSGKHRLLLIC
ncbi:hypothetical protein [Neolewinella agarilytica]|uniref:hypothetical protein n=1 Tax=Neolewinella agarilytica TaxID=478744 RepID=UPI002354CC23|nr:hypothetical protein [Neolewinella agarilytica]